MELIIIFALVLLNGMFAMSELSLVSSRKFKLENAKKKGSQGAKAALELSENPSKFLSTVQIGITLIGIMLGFYSGDALTNNLAELISKVDFLAPYSKQIAGPAIVIFITYLSIVFGELFPKQLGMTFPEKISIFVAPTMKLISKITSPFVWLLTFSNEILLKIFGIKKNVESSVSEEELKAIIRDSAEGGEIDDIEQNIVERVFELGDTKASNLFTYKNQIVFFDIEDSKQTILDKIQQEQHSAYPVTEENNLDKIIGVVLLKDLFLLAGQEKFDLKVVLKSPVYVTENMAAFKVLENFRTHKMHYGIVIDEYGNTQGMITMDDVMDALVGDMSEEGQEEYEYKIVQRADGSWLIDGQYSLKNFSKEFDLEVEEDVFKTVQTIAGFILNESNQLPEVGDTIVFGNFAFEIMDKDGQRIDKILVTKK